LSGGIDSVVAGYLMSKKLDLSAIHFHNYPFTDESELNKAEKLCKLIGVKEFNVVQHGEYQKQVMKNCNRRYQCVMCRRMMFRLACELAKREGIDFLVTGENLAQVASQTLENMETTDNVSSIPVLRPLLCYDKNEIIKIANTIKSFEISTGAGVCCLAVPKNPATKSTARIIEIEEEKLDMDLLVKSALNGIKTKEI